MRKNWDDYFMDIAFMVKERSTCPRLQVGAVIVKDKRIKATGYNGSPPGFDHCVDVGCLMIAGHCRRTIHAEVNAIMECSPEERKGATIYITAQPCMECSKLIIASGITRVVYSTPYEPEYDFFKYAPWIEIVRWERGQEGIG
ncbi:MAG TPA: dCMP deaminase family protein [Thermoanaerobacterales bacterium]|nr:dCMP deaminase family protein [Thermoanaerobacterales bacterium]